MTTLLNTIEYESKGDKNIVMQLNDLYIQVKFHGSNDAKAEEYKNKIGRPTVRVIMKLPNPPSNSEGEQNDYAVIKTIVDQDDAFKITVPAGTDVRATLTGNTVGRRVRVWGIEA